MPDINVIIILITIITGGILSGLFFVFSNTIMKSLYTIEPEVGIKAMQQINSTIINPLFMIMFMGTPLLSLYLVIVAWTGTFGTAGYWLIPGGLIHLLGSFLVTIVGNVPLNNTLAVVNPLSLKGNRVWLEYKQKWVPLNHVRTVASVLSTMCFAIALLTVRG